MLYETKATEAGRERWLWRERVGGEDKRPTRTEDHILLDLIRGLSGPKK